MTIIAEFLLNAQPRSEYCSASVPRICPLGEQLTPRLELCCPWHQIDPT